MPARFLPVFLFLAACLTSAAQAATFTGPNQPKPWSYDEDYTGQEEWGWMTPAYAACGSGTQQSPIQIGHTTSVTAPSPVFAYHKVEVTLVNRGHTLEIGFFDGNLTYTEAGHVYRLRAIWFRSPAEHMVRGAYYPLEIQMLHEDDKGQMLIVAVFATMNGDIPALADIIASMPDKQGISVKAHFDPSVLIPASLGYFAYIGSMTIPPCQQGIQWRVFKTPINISKPQLSAITRLTGRNARLPQPVYMRKVREVN